MRLDAVLNLVDERYPTVSCHLSLDRHREQAPSTETSSAQRNFAVMQ